jgi:transposase
VTCSCGYTTLARIEEVPTSPFGPRLMSLVALLTGVYHLSRRQAVVLLHDLLGVRLSLGAVSAIEDRVSVAVEPAVREAWTQIDSSTVKHADATSWLQAGQLRSLWTIATQAVTVFKILIDGSTESIRPLFGACRGILVSDRATVFSFWAMVRRQICWAHLLRKFVSFSERDGPARAIGRELLDYAALVFRYWKDYRVGAIDTARYRAWMAPVRVRLEDCLARAAAADIREVSGSCADILAHKEALWTFVERDDVEPTNNHAERELRAFVLWRKRSFGAQSDRGHLFAERVMTVAHTARKQGKSVLAFITACCKAQLEKVAGPWLLVARLAA